MNWYQVDKQNSDDEYLYIDIIGIGTVCIKKDEEGIVVDMWGKELGDSPTASMWATYDQLNPKEGTDE